MAPDSFLGRLFFTLSLRVQSVSADCVTLGTKRQEHKACQCLSLKLTVDPPHTANGSVMWTSHMAFSGKGEWETGSPCFHKGEKSRILMNNSESTHVHTSMAVFVCSNNYLTGYSTFQKPSYDLIFRHLKISCLRIFQTFILDKNVLNNSNMVGC